MDEIGFGRCATAFSGACGAFSDSIVALRLRFRGDGAPTGAVDGGGSVVRDALL
jgi:hypothetical protein